MSKQTAVEWLEEQRKWSVITNEHIEQAKAMEKEQIKYAFGQGSLFDPVFPDQFHYRADDYYQQHYGQ